MPQPESAPTYRIRDWSKHFEKAQSRACATTKWVAVPNKHDGISYRRLIGMECGIEHFGIWVLLLELASKQPSRGTLARDGKPLTAEDMALATGASRAAFEAAIPALVSVGWLETISEPSGNHQCADGRLSANYEHAEGSLELQDRTLQDRIEKNKTSKSTSCSAAPNESFENLDSEMPKSADQGEIDDGLPWDQDGNEDEPPATADHAATPEQLAELYDAYPRKGHRAAALKAAGVALSAPGAPTYAALMATVQEFAAAYALLDDEQKAAVPLCSTWLRDGRWEDDRLTWQPNWMPRRGDS